MGKLETQDGFFNSKLHGGDGKQQFLEARGLTKLSFTSILVLRF